MFHSLFKNLYIIQINAALIMGASFIRWWRLLISLLSSVAGVYSRAAFNRVNTVPVIMTSTRARLNFFIFVQRVGEVGATSMDLTKTLKQNVKSAGWGVTFWSNLVKYSHYQGKNQTAGPVIMSNSQPLDGGKCQIRSYYIDSNVA